MQLLSSLLALLGLADASYLSFEHFSGAIPPCTVGGCETVLTSPYATIAGIPLALLGVGYYLALLVLTRLEGQRSLIALAALTSFGVAASAGLVYLQVAVIGAICLYCLISAGTTTLLWILTLIRMRT